MPTAIYRAILKSKLFSSVSCRNMFTFQINRNEEDTTLDVASDYVEQIVLDIRDYLCTGWVCESIELQILAELGWFTQDERAFLLSGTLTSEQLANVMAAVMIGVVPNVRAHGRKFWSGLAEASVNGNSMTVGALAAFATATADWITTFHSEGGSDLFPGIVAKDGTFHNFSNGFVSSLLGTMRRRKPGLGM